MDQLGVFLAVRREDVKNIRRFKSRSLMLDAPVNYDAVAGAHLPTFAFGLKEDMPADDVDHLMMGMAVARALPTFLKGVTHEHEMRVVREDLANHAGLGRGGPGGVGGRVDNCAFAHQICLKLGCRARAAAR